MQTLPGLCPSVPLILCHFDYDYMSRRPGKTVYEWISNDWQEASASVFLYDAWNLVQELQVSGFSPQPSYFVLGPI